MLNVQNHPAKVTKVNPLSENHGDEVEPAGSITVEVIASNQKLDELQPGLRDALCRAPTAGDQGSLIEAKTSDGKTAVRFPLLGTTWAGEYPGYEVQIAGGLGLEDPIVLVDAKLKNISWKLLEGGSVAFKVTIIAHPDADEAGQLWYLQKREIDLTLTPPAAQAQQDDLGGGDTLDAQDAADAAAEASSLIEAGKKAA
ncbi:hypothetical protein OCJ37_14510 [Xanthomonas sp. AM6]|uniref:hypothetical protein n=1 Tax=Xanthomonas sp. AM6 TaxID=2982531 RepID=UPI0021D8489F|nr:hypothetical protein [Xanthomonas sp. AM6]UYB51198.1 hypothetical protein OCJ37_14510 [Xanthomonas sp. AM6]